MARVKMIKSCGDLSVKVHVGRSIVILCDDAEILELSFREALEFEKKLHLALATEIMTMINEQKEKSSSK